MNKRGIIFFLFCVLYWEVNAQDIILSQPYVASQFLSPATVGLGGYQNRVQTNYKSQMFDGNNQNRTIVLGWDSRFKKKDAYQKNFLGVGAQIMSDQMIGGLIQTNHVTLNLSYHLFLNDEDQSSLSLGLGGTFSNASVDKSKLRFGDQYDDLTGVFKGYNTSFENIKPFPYKISANTGLLYTSHTNKKFIQASANAFFYGMPEMTTSNLNEASKLKLGLFLNYEQLLGEFYTMAAHASYYNRLNNSDITRQVLTGVSIGLPFTHDVEEVKRFYVGAYYRIGDAIIPSIAILMNQYRFGLSYELYNNAITGASIRQNGFELTFSKSFGAKRNEFLRTIFD